MDSVWHIILFFAAFGRFLLAFYIRHILLGGAIAGNQFMERFLHKFRNIRTFDRKCSEGV